MRPSRIRDVVHEVDLPLEIIAVGTYLDQRAGDIESVQIQVQQGIRKIEPRRKKRGTRKRHGASQRVGGGIGARGHMAVVESKFVRESGTDCGRRADGGSLRGRMEMVDLARAFLIRRIPAGVAARRRIIVSPEYRPALRSVEVYPHAGCLQGRRNRGAPGEVLQAVCL